MRVSDDIHARRNRHHADIVMRAGADAIETKRAVEVAEFAREMEIHFATALTLVSAQAIMRLATGADSWFAHFDFKRRDQRGDGLVRGTRPHIDEPQSKCRRQRPRL